MSRIFIGAMAFIAWGSMVAFEFMSVKTLVALMLGLSSGLLTQWFGGQKS